MMSDRKNIVYLFLTLLVASILIVGARSTFTATASGATNNYLPLVLKPAHTPTNTPVPTPTPDEWFSYINYLRGLGGLANVAENTDWSYGCELHSRYMVKTDEIAHKEDPLNDWYTPEGDAAGQNGNVMVSSSSTATDEYGIDLWMSGPFHGIGILDPQLEVVGFGSYREAIGTWQMGATLDVSRGRTSAEPPAGTYPVMWPGDGQSTAILGYQGTEWPDPLTSCPGFSADYWNPSGPPIYLQLGSGSLTPDVTATSFKQGNTELEHCVFDETSYINSESYDQYLGRLLLASRDAIIIMPKAPLQAGSTYSVSITSNGQVYAWSFTAASSTWSQPQASNSRMQPAEIE